MTGFYINLPIGGIVAALLVWVDVPDASGKTEGSAGMREFYDHLDLIGFTFFAPAAVMLLLALQYGGNQFAWDSSQVIGLFCGSAATFIVFGIWNYRAGEKALIPVPLLRQQAIWSSCLVVTFNMAITFLASYYLPIYFQTVKGASALMSGVYLLPSIIAQMIFAVGSGVLGKQMCQSHGQGLTRFGNMSANGNQSEG
jgi:hypothetical protein